MDSVVIYIADNQYIGYLGLNAIFRSFYGPDAIIEQITSREVLDYKIEKTPPFLIAIDYQRFEMQSVCDFIDIKKRAPKSNILVVSDSKDGKQIKEVIKTGISHYVFKSGTEDDFYNALYAIQNKRKYFCSDLYDILIQKEKRSYDPSDNIRLSNSEIEIVKLIADGKTTKEIAEIKQLSFHTINTHRKNIFRKLNINNSSELVKYAMNAGLMNDIEYYI